MAARVMNPTHLSDLAGRGLVTRAGSATAAQERTLPLVPVLAAMVPHGAVQRGTVVGCEGAAAVSLAMAVAAGPSQQGAWVAVVGLPTWGLAAAAEAGVALERLVAVTEPTDPHGAASPFDDDVWAELLAACIDGFDVVVLGPGAQQVRPATARRLVARLQARGAVAVQVGAPVFGADLRFECTRTTWSGLGDGHGVARARQVQLELSGRRVPQVRRAECWLPAVDGQARPCESTVDDGTVLPLRRTG